MSSPFRAAQACVSPPVPVVVLLAVDAAVLAEAGELRLQVQFALAAFEAAHVPLFIHGQQVVTVRYLPTAARTQGHPLTGHAWHGLAAQHEEREAEEGRQENSQGMLFY